MAARTFLGTLRLAILVAVLLFVALGAWLDRARSRDWNDTLRVTVYPISASTDAAVRAYTAALRADDFADVESFFVDEASAHGITLAQPVRIRVSHAAKELPPALPDRPGPLTIALWSLRFRYFAARTAWNDPLPAPDIQVFALYSPLGPGSVAMPDSVGLSKGLIALTHLYGDAAAAGSNQVVLVHEVLHTLGATDKYDFATGQPLAPTGLGEPDRQPLYPQTFGEIMAGRIATSPHDAAVADDLEQMLVGPATALEIGWPQ
ncbi:MAG: hypothetical protein OEY13_11650 [Gammaproteobacteria bacterium]|nr:hypothetical protein [Gammaproteobacteria bacterium]MDH4311956.1 hypothetical protein [Gammaproteobacteria bacterium]MDH5273718.1 hypothetical protein [Gammaproteobacteria bacterium]